MNSVTGLPDIRDIPLQMPSTFNKVEPAVLSPLRVLAVLAAIAALLASVGWMAGVQRLFPDIVPVPHIITRRFILIDEHTVAAWYSSLLLFTAAILLGVIVHLNGMHASLRSRWRVLAIVFLFLSMDEAVALHETIPMLLLKLGIDTQWMYFGAAFVVVLGIYLIRWFRSFDSRMRKILLLSAVMFVGGALGVETLSGVVARSHGIESIAYVSMATVEETLEMLGCCLFVYALLDHIRATHREIHIHLR